MIIIYVIELIQYIYMRDDEGGKTIHASNITVYCNAFDREIDILTCKNCSIKKRYGIPDLRKCPHYDEYVTMIVNLKAKDMQRINRYAKKKGGNPVNHYIREAIAEYLEKHE